MKIPNLLTITRFMLIFVIIYLLYLPNANSILLSIVLFVIAVLSDWLDGFIARKYNLSSVFGTFFDPLVDKMLILGIFFAFADLKLIPLWLVLLLLFRELFVTGIRQTCSSRKKIVGANWMGKSKFVVQAANIIFLQLILFFSVKGVANPVFNASIGYFFTLFMVILSLAYAANFLYWYRKELLSDL